MKHKKESIIFVLILLFLFSLMLGYNKFANKKDYFEQDGILLSISDGNGGTLSSVPAKDYYEVTAECTNAEGSWDYDLWKLNVKNIVGNVTCSLTFKSVSATQTFAQYIASLAGTTQGNGIVANENGYRYQGKDPDNYVWFNDELWRIIGVFATGRHGVSNDPRTIGGSSSTYLVKIIRDESIGAFSWDGSTSMTNNWPSSTLYNMLNVCYYDAQDGSSEICDKSCFKARTDSSYVSSICDFTLTGIHNNGVDTSYQDMVQTATWYLGGPGKTGYTTYTAPSLYGYETNSSAIYSGNSTSAMGKVGLMYLSDYAYAYPASLCPRTTELWTNFNLDCGDSGWLSGRGNEWMVTPRSEANRALSGQSIVGGFAADIVWTGYAVRPVVYLKSKTFKLDGTGSKSDPYIIGSKYEYENTFNYSSSVQSVQIEKAGYYKLEVYGGAGGNAYNSSTYAGGKGGYAKGTIHLNKNDTLYIHTGGAGKGSTSKAVQSGGANGGGAGGYNYGGSGGGGTDIRIGTDSLYARVIVAGGGGGGCYYSGYTGGNGGGTSGSNGTGYSTTYNAKGGGTTSGGAGGSYNGGNYKGSDGTFGNGGAAATSTTSNYGRSGGGGGG